MEFREIEKAAKDLGDAKAGWVTRRDAAESLGAAAGRALEILHAHKDEPDVDVRAEVQRALGRSSASLAGIAATAAERPHSLEELARSCEKSGKRTVQPHENGFVVEVKLREDRTSSVYLMPAEHEGVKLIRVFTRCGPLTEKALVWALRTNARLIQCALALTEEGGQQGFILTNTFIESQTTPAEIQAAIKEIAYYGDWIAERLSGGGAG